MGAGAIVPGFALAFFASGFASLLHQIAWQRLLGLFAGSDSVTASLVVGAFLGGIGLGAFVATGFADRRSPRGAAIAFGLCELAIGGYALLSPWLLHDVVAARMAGHTVNGTQVFAVCFLALLPATLAMGLSLPLVARAVVARIEDAAPRIGLLYGLNTVGAGAGALVGGFWLLGSAGFDGTITVGALCNLAAAVFAFAIARALPRERPLPAPRRDPAQGARGSGSGLGLVGWTALVFVSGFLIVGLEIVWLRLVGLMAQTNAYVFSLILAVFLFADGLGVVVGARLVRRIQGPRDAFLLLQGLAALWMVATILLLWASGAGYGAGGLLAVDRFRLDLPSLAAAGLLAVVLVGPPAFLLGASFPLVQKAVQRDLASLGRKVALVQLGNILGNAAGGIATGLVLFDRFGTAGTVVLFGILGLVLLAPALAAGGRRRGFAAATAFALAVLLALVPANGSFWQRLHAAEAGDVLQSEDRSGVTLLRLGQDDQGPLFIQGHSQSHLPFFAHHYLIGALGPLLHDAPRTALVIGVGSGGTPYGAGWHPGLTEIRTIELVGPVFDVVRDYARRHPDSAPARLFDDPRFRLVVGDGRREVLQADRTWDLVEIDAILPQTSHSGLLYSVEFMEALRDRLAEGGLVVLWAPSERVVAAVTQTFDHAVLLRPASILVASSRPIPDVGERLRAAQANPRFVAWARAAGLDPARFADQIAGQALRWAPGDPRPEIGPNTDLHPRDEFYLNNEVLAPNGTHWRP